MREAQGASQLIAIFQAIAAVDQHIDAREIALIEEFSNRWGIPVPDLTEGATDDVGDVLELRKHVADYLELAPPTDQVTELLDVLHHFINADDYVSEAEEVVVDEVTAMILKYVTKSGDHGAHEVIIVPQTDEQTAGVAALMPGVEPTTMRGGTVYSVGRFFSPKYADVVCDKYIELGFFTTRVEELRPRR